MIVANLYIASALPCLTALANQLIAFLNSWEALHNKDYQVKNVPLNSSYWYEIYKFELSLPTSNGFNIFNN